jgi:hypothetical protein
MHTRGQVTAFSNYPAKTIHLKIHRFPPSAWPTYYWPSSFLGMA